MAKRPQGVVRTLSRSPSHGLNLPIQQYLTIKRRTLRLDHPGLICNNVRPPTEVHSTTRIAGERTNWRRAKAHAQCVRQTRPETEEDLRAHLEARRTSTSSKKNNVPIFSPMHDENNELRKRLDKLVAKSSEAIPSTTSSPFSLEIQPAPLPVIFRMPTMTTYEGKTDPQDHLDAFND